MSRRKRNKVHQKKEQNKESSRKPSKEPSEEKFESNSPWWRKPLVWIGGIVTALVTAGVVALGTGFGQHVSTLISNRSAPALPGLGSLSIAESNGLYKFIVPISGLQQTVAQVKSVNISVEWTEPSNSCGIDNLASPNYWYTIAPQLTIQAGHNVQGAVIPESGIAAGSTVRAVGSLDATGSNEFAATRGRPVNGEGQCKEFHGLDLTFRPPALILAHNEEIFLSIALPREISASDGSSQRTKVEIPDFTKPTGPMTTSISVQFPAGKETSSCKITTSSTC